MDILIIGVIVIIALVREKIQRKRADDYANMVVRKYDKKKK